MHSETELAYLAGIIDGEGTIVIGRRRSHSRRRDGSLYPSSKRQYLQVKITILNTDRGLHEWLSKTFGFGVVQRPRNPDSKHFPNQKPIWLSSLYKEESKRLLERLSPYLIIKRRRAEEAIQAIKWEFR